MIASAPSVISRTISAAPFIWFVSPTDSPARRFISSKSPETSGVGGIPVKRRIGKLCPKEGRLTDDRKIIRRRDFVGRRVVATLPLAHQTIPQPARRRIRELGAEDKVSRLFIDLGGENAALVFLVG